MTTLVPVVELAKALKTELDSALGVDFQRVYAPFMSAEDCATDTYLIMANTEEISTKRRIDILKLSIVLAYQLKLPDASPDYRDPLKNTPFFDGCMEKVEDIKALFREGGALNEKSISNCVFQSISNSPIYRPDFVVDYQIFTSEIKLDFLSEE